MGQVAWISSVIARKSVPEILLGALLLVGDIAWLTLLCLCSVVWMRAALCTSCMVEPCWLTMALRYLHARTAAALYLAHLPPDSWRRPLGCLLPLLLATWLVPYYRGGPHMRSLISIDFPAPEMEPESAHVVVSAVSVP